VAGLRILSPGARTTVQDGGFRGGRGQGVPGCGVLDADALWLVNALLNNDAGTAAIEVALTAPTLRAEGGPVRLALGDGLRGVVRAPDGSSRTVGSWTATTLQTDAELVLSAPDRGATALIGIAGGLDLPLILGSRSTCLKAGFGGFHGRALRAGDLLPVAHAGAVQDPDLCLPPLPVSTGPFRIVPGPQAEWFDAAQMARFLDEAWTVTPDLDRMGLRLAGRAITFAAGRGPDITSDGIAPGTIQVPGSGQPIILLADAQTTGGYPKIATIIGADLPRLARAMPGDSLRFAAVTLAEAEAAARARAALLQGLAQRIAPVRAAGPDIAALWRESLIGGMVDSARPDHFPGALTEKGLR
jgi:5-oxoprolinase (ATP-hydrolysing) subunit C